MRVKIKSLNGFADLLDGGNSWYRFRILWYCRGNSRITGSDQKKAIQDGSVQGWFLKGEFDDRKREGIADDFRRC